MTNLKRTLSVVGLTLLLLLSTGQAPVLIYGTDSSGNIRALSVDTTGHAIASSSTSSVAATASSQTTSIATNGTPCTTPGGASCTVLYPVSVSNTSDYSTWTALTVTIRNSGSNTLTNCIIEWSPDGSNYESWDAATFAALASGSILSLSFSGNSRRYLRIEGRSASGTTVQVDVNANAG